MAEEAAIITRDDEIKFNLGVYIQPISECVDATHLLMNLSTFSNEQRKKLTKLAKTSPVEATKEAIGIILKDETPGIGTELMQCLEDDYPKIRKFLRGERVKCDNSYQEIIKLFSQEITSRIKPNEILPGLSKHGVLPQTECDEIIDEQENSGQRNAMWTTILYVNRHHEEWFKYFLMTLIDTDYEDVAVMLDPDLVDKIKVQRNEESQIPSESTIADQDDVVENVYEEIKVQRNEESQIPSESTIADQDDVVENVYEDYESGHFDVGLNEPFQTSTSLQAVSISVSVACSKKSESTDKFLIDPVKESYANDSSQFDDEKSRVTSLKQIVEEETPASDLKHLVEDESHGTHLKQSFDKGHHPNNLNQSDCPTYLKQTVDKGQYFNNMNLFVDKSHNITNLIQEVDEINEEEERHQTLMKLQSVVAERTDGPGIDLTHSDEDQSDCDSINNLVVNIRQTFQEANNLNLQQHEERSTPSVMLHEGQKPETELNNGVEGPGKYIIPALRQGQKENNDAFYPNEIHKTDDVLLYKKDGTSSPTENIHYSNTSSDKDTLPSVPEYDISLYNYQRKWAEKGADGTNLILIAPTNSGKTRVACKIIYTMFKRMKDTGRTGKVVFIVDRDELASQQGSVLAEQLPGYRTKIVTGPVQQNHNQYLKDYVHRRDILVVTAQVLLNCLKAKEISGLDVFSLLVFDECHHTDKKHPFKELMDIYFEMKINNTSIPPQVIGLTATIGVAGSLDQLSALEHMKSIAANLDACALVCPDDEDKIEIKSSIPKTEVRAVPWDQRRTFSQDIHQVILNMNEFISTNASIQQLTESDKFMEQLCKVPMNIGTSQFQNWLSAFRDGIDVLESDGARHVLNPCYSYLEKYHVAMELFNDVRTMDAKNVLRELNETRQRAVVNDAVDNFLLSECRKILDKSFDGEPENPKLLELSEIITKSMSSNHDARCIVFVKTRILALKLTDWMNQTDELKIFKAKEFLGQASDGMTTRARTDTLMSFKEGIHKVIIATTVAEEGLDIAACNLVIRYEHVTNENSRGQSRGRARAEDSHYFVITNKGSWIIEKEEHNAKCEKLMLHLIPRLKECVETDRNKWEVYVMTIQRQAKAQREIDRLNMDRNMIPGPVRIHCKNCATYLCSSNDLRVVAGMHRVVIAPEIREKLLIDETFKVKHFSQQYGFSLGGNVYCRQQKCIFKHRIGGVMEFKRVHFPTLSLESISFRDNEDKPLALKKKWGKIPIQIESIDIVGLYDLNLIYHFN